MKGTTKSNGQKDPLDRFYTSPEAVQECLSKLDLSQYDIIIEPSAGRGAFSSQIPHCIAYDIDPQARDIIQQDFLSLSYSRDTTKKTLVIGNPPYGQQCKLAITFFSIKPRSLLIPLLLFFQSLSGKTLFKIVFPSIFNSNRILIYKILCLLSLLMSK